MDVDESTLMALYGWKDAGMARHYARQALQARAIEAHERHSPMQRLSEKRGR